jgi:hypothetical protein
MPYLQAIHKTPKEKEKKQPTLGRKIELTRFR